MDGDAYLLRLILHDWSDEDSIAILSSVRHAIGKAKARLLIVEVTGPSSQGVWAGAPIEELLMQALQCSVHQCLLGILDCAVVDVLQWQLAQTALAFKLLECMSAAVQPCTDAARC